jgi:hypothetical protein
MSFHIQLRVNLVKSRKQISKHQNQGYWKFCTNNQRKKHKCRIARVPKCLTQVPNCLGAEMSHTGAEVSSIPLTHIHSHSNYLAMDERWQSKHPLLNQKMWSCKCVPHVWNLQPYNVTGDWGCLKNTDSLQNYKIKTRKSVPDFSRGHNSRDTVVGGFTFTYTIRSYNH